MCLFMTAEKAREIENEVNNNPYPAILHDVFTHIENAAKQGRNYVVYAKRIRLDHHDSLIEELYKRGFKAEVTRWYNPGHSLRYDAEYRINWM